MKKGQITLGALPMAVLTVGFIFLVMATVAYIGEKYGDALTDGSTAQNVTIDLNAEISNNTSIAGIVLTILLVSSVLTILMGIFLVVRGGRGM